MIRQPFIILLLTCLTLYSCNNTNVQQTEPPAITAPDTAGQYAAAIHELNRVFEPYSEPSQLFKISAHKPGEVNGKKGTILIIDPADLITESGDPLGEHIEVTLLELMNQRALLSTNTPTVSDGRLLVSGGAYYINMTSGGKTLKLKEGKKLQARFPEITGKEMLLFYGERNNYGQLNWKPEPNVFKSTPPAPATANAKKVFRSEVDAIMAYADQADTSPGQPRVAGKTNKEAVTLYEAIGLDRFGWINCDRFLDVREKTTVRIHFPPADSISNARVHLVFNSINSMIQEDLRPGHPLVFEDIPVGYKVTVIAYTVQKGIVRACTETTTIAPGQELTLRPVTVSTNELKQLVHLK